MSTSSSSLLPVELSGWNASWWTPLRQQRAIWLFLFLGILARCVRYFLCFPLWEDECFLCVSLLNRNYRELMQPLEYHQLCPFPFLWAQLTLVKLFGFNEYSLRLLPFLSGLASLVLFRHMAARLLGGTTLVMAVAIFSVTYAGVRYSAEAKPYGMDLFFSVLLLTLAVEWWRAPDKTRWIWAMVAITPIAILASFPAVFIAGGISLLLLAIQCRRGARAGWLAWLAYNLAMVASFLALLMTTADSYDAKTSEVMQGYWRHTFPPISQPLELARWTIVTHTSDLLSYPMGGARGASIVTFLWCLTGLLMLFRGRHYRLLLWAIAPCVLTFVAAALQRYPYGGHIRFNLYLAPLVCIVAGIGLTQWLVWTRPLYPRRFENAPLVAALVLLALVGWLTIARDLGHPYKTLSDVRQRAFARWFWFNSCYDGEVACARTDLGQEFSPDTYEQLSWAAMYLCNQRIYSPRHAQGQPLCWDRVSADHPLRCVLYRDPQKSFNQAAYQSWRSEMEQQYRLAGHETYSIPRYDKRERDLRTVDIVEIFRFVPRR